MIIVLIAFLILLAIGMPVGFSIGISGVFYFLQHAELPMATIGQLPISQTQSVTLLAVPLFIFAGSLMNSSGITDRLIKLAMLLAGHMRGGMAQVSVILSTLMGGCSGSSNADAAMEARILGPEMLKQGYPRGYAAVVIGFTSLITSTIPPGVGMILYGTVGEVSIGRLFSAGIMSGLIMMVAFMITVAITARRRNFPRARETRAPIQGNPPLAEGYHLGVDFPNCLDRKSSSRTLHPIGSWSICLLLCPHRWLLRLQRDDD